MKYLIILSILCITLGMSSCKKVHINKSNNNQILWNEHRVKNIDTISQLVENEKFSNQKVADKLILTNNIIQIKKTNVLTLNEIDTTNENIIPIVKENNVKLTKNKNILKEKGRGTKLIFVVLFALIIVVYYFINSLTFGC